MPGMGRKFTQRPAPGPPWRVRSPGGSWLGPRLSGSVHQVPPAVGPGPESTWFRRTDLPPGRCPPAARSVPPLDPFRPAVSIRHRSAPESRQRARAGRDGGSDRKPGRDREPGWDRRRSQVGRGCGTAPGASGTERRNRRSGRVGCNRDEENGHSSPGQKSRKRCPGRTTTPRRRTTLRRTTIAPCDRGRAEGLNGLLP
jgi:hypothetical protein